VFLQQVFEEFLCQKDLFIFLRVGKIKEK